jgi:5-methylcytosine-specific restriction endonuclease McrA
VNDEFTACARLRIANSRRLALRAGHRPVIINALLRRRSLLATLLYDGRRDTDPDAAAEARLIASQTGLSVGRVRNLRTELIAVLREELDDEIRSALAKLAELWGVTRGQAAQLHLRWAEQGDASCVYEQGTARATLDAPAMGGARRRLVSKGRRSRSPQARVNRPARLSIFARDGFMCVYCGTSYRPTIDHRIPRSRGGRTVPDNLVTACWDCNHRKGDKIWPVPAKRGTGASRGR